MKKIICILLSLILTVALCSCDALGGLGAQTTEEDSTVTTKRDRYDDDDEEDEDEDEDYNGGDYSSTSAIDSGYDTTSSESEADTTVGVDPSVMNEIASEINSEQVSSFSKSHEITEYVRISFVDYGDVVIRLRPDIAPITVQNFQKLVWDGFYNDLTMHRIIKDFMIQGGNGAPAGRDADTIKGEFSANGIENPISHIPGVISMARAYIYDSASSQFFIVSGPDALHLDGQYAGFGYVVAGLDVIYQIQNVETNQSDAPIMEVVIGDVCFVTK